MDLKEFMPSEEERIETKDFINSIKTIEQLEKVKEAWENLPSGKFGCPQKIIVLNQLLPIARLVIDMKKSAGPNLKFESFVYDLTAKKISINLEL
jgi:hypothetical protein